MSNSGVQVETCPQCGAPVSLESNTCEYCEAEFIVSSLAYLEKYDRSGIQKYVNHYKELLKENPSDGELNCAMGICYLDLGLYDIAQKYFITAIDEIPEDPEPYYYYALALIQGQPPKTLSLKAVREIESYINSAIQLDDTSAKHYILWALVKHDYYERNGLKVGSPDVQELLKEGKSRHSDENEINQLLQRVPIKNEELLNTLRGE